MIGNPPTLKGVDDNRGAKSKRCGQHAHRSSTRLIEDEGQFLPVESPFNVLVQVVALERYAVTSPLPHLFGSFLPPDDIQRLDSCKLRERNVYCPMAELAAVLADLVGGH